MFNINEKETKKRGWMIANALVVTIFLGSVLSSTNIEGQIANVPHPTSQSVVVLGEIENIFVDDMDEMFSAGWIIADGVAVRIPSGLMIDLPANRLTISKTFL